MALPPLKLTLVALVVTFGGNFQFGYQLSVVNPSEDVFHHYLNSSWHLKHGRDLEEGEFSLLWTLTVNILYFGALLGALLVSVVAERLGRKNAILLANIPSVIGIVLICVWPSSRHFELLVVGRFLIGCHIGLSSGLQPLYLTEISPAKFRGILCAFQELFIVSIVAFGTIVGLPDVFGTEERFMLLLALPAIPTVIHTICMLIFHETPKHLLLTMKRRPQAEKAVLFFAGPNTNVHEALEEIEEEALAENVDSTFLKTAQNAEGCCGSCKRVPFSAKLAIFIGIVAGMSQICTGIIGLENFSTSMFIAAGISDKYAKYATVGVTVTNAFAAVAALGAVHRVGRRRLLLLTIVGTMVCNCIYATFARIACSWCGYPSVAAYIIHTIFFSFGVGPIPWFLAAEMVPQIYRASAQMSSTVSIWLSTIITGVIFYPLSKIEVIGPLAVLIVYVGPAVFCLVFLLFFMPETRGRELGEITKDLEKKRWQKKKGDKGGSSAKEIRYATGTEKQSEQYV